MREELVNNKVFRRQILSQLGNKVTGQWLLDCAFDWLVIAVTFTAAGLVNHPLGYIVALFIVGNRQHALAILGHEGTHRTIHRSKKVNDRLSDFLAFFPILFNTAGYRFLHGKHHQNLNTENDPELMHRSAKAPQWDLPTSVPKVVAQCFLDLVGYSVTDFMAFLLLAKADNKKTYIYMAAYHVSFIAACFAAEVFWVAAIWYLALPTTFMMFFRLRTWLEHQGTNDTHRVKLNRIERALIAPHNIELHYEHHAFPSVSYRNLPELRQRISDKSIMTTRDLIHFHKNSKHIPSGQALRELSPKENKLETQEPPANTNQDEKLVAQKA